LLLQVLAPPQLLLPAVPWQAAGTEMHQQQQEKPQLSLQQQQQEQ
jgi:hypothetical protein